MSAGDSTCVSGRRTARCRWGNWPTQRRRPISRRARPCAIGSCGWSVRAGGSPAGRSPRSSGAGPLPAGRRRLPVPGTVVRAPGARRPCDQGRLHGAGPRGPPLRRCRARRDGTRSHAGGQRAGGPGVLGQGVPRQQGLSETGPQLARRPHPGERALGGSRARPGRAPDPCRRLPPTRDACRARANEISLPSACRPRTIICRGGIGRGRCLVCRRAAGTARQPCPGRRGQSGRVARHAIRFALAGSRLAPAASRRLAGSTPAPSRTCVAAIPATCPPDADWLLASSRRNASRRPSGSSSGASRGNREASNCGSS